MHSLLPPDRFLRHMGHTDDDVPPPPPPRTTSIRCRPAAAAVVSKSLVNLAPSSTCSATGRSFRRTVPHPHRHVHSSSSSSSSSNDTFLESLRRDFSVPEFQMRSLPSSSECVMSPAARSDCSTNSSGVVTCPSLSSLSGGSPDTTKGMIARSVSKPVRQPERQFVHSADSSTASVSSSDSSAASATVIRAQSVQCVSRAFERLSVVSSAGTSSSSGTGGDSESSGPVSRSIRSESPPPPLPPKLFLSSRSAQSCSSLRIPDTGCVSKQQQVRATGSRRKENDSRSRTSENHRPHNHCQVRVQSAAGKNNASSTAIANRSSSDRRTCEKSGNRMVYLDAMRRVKTSDTEIRAIQKRALMEFYFNCFKENTKNIQTLSPERPVSPVARDIPSMTSSAPAANDSRSDCDHRPPAFQTALPARVLAAETEDETAVIDSEKQSSHKEAGVDVPKADDDDVCTKDRMSELEIALQRKQTLIHELKLNQIQSSELMSKMRDELSAYEIEKLSRCSEITVVTQLVLSLRSRLKSLEKEMLAAADGHEIRNNLQNNRHHCCNDDKRMSGESGLSPDRSTDKAVARSSTPSSPESSDANDDQDVRSRKMNKLQLQLDEAMSLKDMIALRSHRIRQEILSKCSGKESEANHSIQYIILMNANSELLTEISDVSDRISSLQQQASVTSDLT